MFLGFHTYTCKVHKNAYACVHLHTHFVFVYWHCDLHTLHDDFNFLFVNAHKNKSLKEKQTLHGLLKFNYFTSVITPDSSIIGLQKPRGH